MLIKSGDNRTDNMKKSLNMNWKAQSGYGILTTLLILLIAALLMLELGTDFLERMGGRLMQWSNHKRPQIGTTWEYQSQSAAAMQQLSEVVSLREEIRRELQTMEDFARLPRQLAGGKVLPVSREKFLELYEKLPEVFARKLGNPLKLMEFTIAKGWNRTAFAGYNGWVDIYFLNSQNYVLEKVSLDETFFSELERWGMVITGDLDTHPDFSGRVFTAQEFIDALWFMDDTFNYFPGGIELLKNGGALVKIGVSRRWEAGVVEMGFQFDDGTVKIYPAPDDFAFQLLDHLPEDNFEESEQSPEAYP